MYHVRQLMKAGLVQKSGPNYELTQIGKLQADTLHPKTLSKYEQPRVIVLIACWDDAKGLLLFKRRTHPVINMIGFPHTSIHIGKSLILSAESDFMDLSGLEVSLKRRGDGYITMRRSSEPESYVLFHLLEGRNPKGVLREVTEAGELVWYKDPQLQKPEFLPSMAQLVQLLLQPTEQPFFVELEYTI